MVKECEYCGAKFDAVRISQKYCCHDCACKAQRAFKRKNGFGFKGPRDGYFRPGSCHRCCIYNHVDGCRYKLREELTEPIACWQDCQYFDDGDIFKDKRVRHLVYRDSIYGHKTAYMDAHSAVWRE